MAYSSLKDISAEKDTWNIKVRVTRMWDAVNFKKDNELISLDMILLDEEGTAIHASIRKNQVERIKKLISEGEVYAIRDFRVVKASSSYKPVPNKLKILFMLTTYVTPLNGGKSPIPMHYFEFADHTEIERRCNDNTNLTDVIGRLHRLQPITKVSGNAIVRTLELELDEKNFVKANIWGTIALEIDDMYDSTSSLPDIVIITSTTIKFFAGQYVHSTTSASKLFFNLDLAEVSRLHARFAHSDPCITISPSESTLYVPDEELALQNRKKVADLAQHEWVSTDEGKKITCLAKVKDIDSTFGWFYISCELHRNKAQRTSDGFFCHKCNGPPIILTPRYKLDLIVNDSSGSTTFVIFDSITEKLVNKTAKELALMATQTFDNKELPILLQNLCGSVYIFQIQLSAYNIKDGSEKYTVTRVWNPTLTGEGEPDKEPLHVAPKRKKAQKKTSLLQDSMNMTPPPKATKRKTKLSLERHDEACTEDEPTDLSLPLQTFKRSNTRKRTPTKPKGSLSLLQDSVMMTAPPKATKRKTKLSLEEHDVAYSEDEAIDLSLPLQTFKRSNTRKRTPTKPKGNL